MAMRVDLSRVNKGVFESLVKAGAFDNTVDLTKINRGNIFGVIEKALERGKSAQKDRESGQTSLFGTSPVAAASSEGAPSLVDDESTYEHTLAWQEQEILANEKKTLGFFMSGHPMERFEKEVARLTGMTTLSINKKRDGDEVAVAGIISGFSERKTKKGTRLGLGAIEDLDGRANIIVFSRTLEKTGDIFKSSEPVLIKGRLKVDGDGENTDVKISVMDAVLLRDVRATRTREVHIVVDGDRFQLSLMDDFKSVLLLNTGRCDAFVIVLAKGARTLLKLPDQYRLAPSDALIDDLSKFAGVKDILFK
jgi:DNA polymerase-3 subunit alpha